MKRTPKIFNPIEFPPLTEEQKSELEFLKNMKDSEIDFSDAPRCDFENAEFYYLQSSVPKLSKENFEWISSFGDNVQEKLNAVLCWARKNNCPVSALQ